MRSAVQGRSSRLLLLLGILLVGGGGGCVYLERDFACVEDAHCPFGLSCRQGSCASVEPNDAGDDGDDDDPPFFAFEPSRFDPAALSPGPALDVTCGQVTFDSSTLEVTGACGPVPEAVLASQSGGPDVAVIPTTGLTIALGSRLRLVGERPVVLAVFGDATVAGALAADATAATPGPGGRSADEPCAAGAGGSGGGGGFGEPGGAAGASSSAGSAVGDAALEVLVGGCNGGTSDGGGGGVGGAGGGAVQVSVAGALEVHGTVSAGGGGGGGGPRRGGGGGGGSGGAVLLEAGSLHVGATGRLTANGGGGGEGGSDDSGTPAGAPGDDAAAASDVPAAGGSGQHDDGGDGGAGGVRAAAAGEGESGSGGGGNGGGGGGVGRIRLVAHEGCTFEAGAVQSPDATSNGAAGCP